MACPSEAGLKDGTRPSREQVPTVPRIVGPGRNSPLRRASQSAHSMSDGRVHLRDQQAAGIGVGSSISWSAISSKRSAGGRAQLAGALHGPPLEAARA